MTADEERAAFKRAEYERIKPAFLAEPPQSASVHDDVLDAMNAPRRVRTCTTHHACDCLGWMAAQYRKSIDGLPRVPESET